VEPALTLARRLWQAIEPLHAVVYFHPGATDAGRALGLKGWWMGYFAGRFAPLGPIGPRPAMAMAYGFAPWMVERALPDAWRFAEPEDVLAARLSATSAALAEVLPPGSERVVEDLAGMLRTAGEACRYDGRPLAAGWLAVDGGDDPYARLWIATTILREHRGDGHVVAAVAAGLRGLDAGITHVATGAMPREVLQKSRGWTDDEWDEGVRRLQAQGLLDRDGRLTKTGGALRRQVEDATDRLAAAPVERLGQTGVERAIDLALPLSRQLVETGVFPIPNPIGAPAP
jgi:Helix-turn-helix family